MYAVNSIPSACLAIVTFLHTFKKSKKSANPLHAHNVFSLGLCSVTELEEERQQLCERLEKEQEEHSNALLEALEHSMQLKVCSCWPCSHGKNSAHVSALILT